MGHTLNADNSTYIRMTVQGLLDKAAAMAAMDELLAHPEYPVKHTLWDLRAARMGLSIQDLREIAGILKLYTPPSKDFANKAAFVINNRMELAMANIFISLSAFLPFKYKAFPKIEPAETYLSE